MGPDWMFWSHIRLHRCPLACTLLFFSRSPWNKWYDRLHFRESRCLYVPSFTCLCLLEWVDHGALQSQLMDLLLDDWPSCFLVAGACPPPSPFPLFPPPSLHPTPASDSSIASLSASPSDKSVLHQSPLTLLTLAWALLFDSSFLTHPVTWSDFFPDHQHCHHQQSFPLADSVTIGITKSLVSVFFSVGRLYDSIYHWFTVISVPLS